MLITGTKLNFTSEVLDATKPVLVDFWAAWCGPCLRIDSILTELNQEHLDDVKIVKVNVDEEIELADTYEIMSIPTLVVFKNGKIEHSLIGVHSKQHLKELLGL